MTDARFLSRRQHREKTSLGDVEVPVVYRDLSACNALFPVEYGLAAQLLADTPLEPVRFATGSALAVVAWFDYRACTLGPYREVGLAIAASPRDQPRPPFPALQVLRGPEHSRLGYWIVDLPVSTPIADAAGRELAGYPKFVTRIDLSFKDGHFSGVVHDPRTDEPMVSLEGPAGTGLPLPAEGQAVFTRLGGALLRSSFELKGVLRVGFGRGLVLDVGDTRHPMAEHLRHLRLHRASPVAIQLGLRLKGVLSVGEPVHRAIAA